MVIELKFDLENPNDRKSMDFFNKRKEIMELLRQIKADFPDEVEEKIKIPVSEQLTEMLEEMFSKSEVNFEELYF